MKLKYAVNLHKGSTCLVVLAMMIYFKNFSLGPLLYLALHGTYGLMWLMKDKIFPDRQWEKQVSAGFSIFAFCALGLYWIAPYVLISENLTPKPEIVAASVFLVVLGTMVHFASDAQKYFTLKFQPGLITTGFFSKSRNANYLGELMIYTGFAVASCHWLGFLGIAAFFVVEFIPNMLRKDRSLSRYPEFHDYKQQSWLLFPKIF
jgi:protein-S-isoprenylcysteine O-methyltransferase Ste14